MRTTLTIDADVLSAFKRLAADTHRTLSGVIEVRAVLADSPHAPATVSGEVEFDPEAPDPPDILLSDAIDLASYVVEHLALEVDPFARKPGAEFDYAPPTAEISPFAALKILKDRGT